MGKKYLDRQRELEQGFFDAGEEIGMQKMWDYVQMCLRDPKIMGKDTFGKVRLRRIYEGLKSRANYFHTAFCDDPEADYVQERMDRELREIWQEELVPFAKRYPMVKKVTYEKARKAWR